MSDIPSNTFREILLRSPTKSLLRFRTVCKSWRQLIDSTSFIKSHTKHQLSSSNNLGNLLIRTSYTGKLFSLPLDSLNFVNGDQTIEAKPVKNLVRLGVPRILSLPVTSCNGLILISHYDKSKTWVLWNPLTLEFYELPEYDHGDEYLRLQCTGIGYDCVNDDFKVVRIDQVYRNEKYVYKTSVYSIKEVTCRWIMDCPCEPFAIPGPSQGVYCNGALYWMSRESVICLDLSTEIYRELKLPEDCSGKVVDYSDTCLVELGGCLVLCRDSWIKRLEGWMMKEDGEGKVSWSKLFSVDKMGVAGGYGCLRPLTYCKSNRHVLFHHEHYLFWYDIDNNYAKKIRIDGLQDSFSCQIWPASLYRLENYVGADEVMSARTVAGVKRKRARVKGLELGITITESWVRSDTEYSSEEDDY